MARALSSLALLLVLLGGLFYLVIPAREPRSQLTRQEFAERFFKVQQWMSQSEVLAILGKPDDIFTEVDPVDLITSNTTEVWCYGTRRHLEAPALGKIEFDFDKRVIFTSNQERKTPRTAISPYLISETELRNLFELLNQIPGSYFQKPYDPLPVIRAVNALQSLGPVKALAVLEEHFEVTGNLGDYLVLLVLFDNPPGPVFLREGLVGPLSDQEFHSRFPLFPIQLIDDVPLFLRAEVQTELYLNPSLRLNLFEYFREKGRFRQKPLTPSGNPFDLLKKWQSWTQGLYTPEEFPNASNCIARQILLLTRTIHEKGNRMDFRNTFPQWEPTSEIKKIIKEENKIPFFWNSRQNLYSFYDQSYYPIIQKRKYNKIVIYFDDLKSNSRLIIERINESRVRFTFFWLSRGETKINSLEISVIQEKDKKILFQPDFKDFATELANGWQGLMEPQEELDLPQGEQVTVTIQLNGQTKTIPGLKP